METSLPSHELISAFLQRNGVTIDILEYLNHYQVSGPSTILPSDIIERIIADAYNLSSEIQKSIVEALMSDYQIYIGRIQKNALKKYIDYQTDNDFSKLHELIQLGMQTQRSENQATSTHSISDIDSFQRFCDARIPDDHQIHKRATQIFINKLNSALLENKWKI